VLFVLRFIASDYPFGILKVSYENMATNKIPFRKHKDENI
jgi:hypothetical protein